MCQRCRQKRFQAKPATPSNRFIKSSGYVGETICIDLFGPLPAVINNENYCLRAIDLFSRYLFAIPIRGKSAPVVAAAFLDHVIGHGDNVLAIHSDNRKEIKNKLFQRMTAILQIKHSYSMPYHPLGNAAIESSHHRIKTILRASPGVMASQNTLLGQRYYE